jgi:hypothetical protein
MAYGHEAHPALPMTYDSSRLTLKDLGEDAGFEDNLGHFTSQERKMVLGQSGDFIFEKHYYHTKRNLSSVIFNM